MDVERRTPVVVAAARSPIGRAPRGGLRGCTAVDLTATVVGAALDRVGDLGPPDDLMVGCGLPTTAPDDRDLARQVALGLGLTDVPGLTVSRWCTSSMLTTHLAGSTIRAGAADVVVAAGVECMSSYPRTRRTGISDAAEVIAREHRVSRAEADEFALRSHRLAHAAQELRQREITAVPTAEAGLVAHDECPRADLSLGELAARTPLNRDPAGRVTAGNCSLATDGAAAIVLAGRGHAHDRGVTPLAAIRSTGTSVGAGVGTARAAAQALARAGLTVADIDLFELNESFAVEVLAARRVLGIPMDKLNPHGGAIAIGHPFGMTGARLVGSLVNALRWHDLTFGLAELCGIGGHGMAVVVERLA